MNTTPMIRSIHQPWVKELSMKVKKALGLVFVFGISSLLLYGTVYAADLSKARDTVDNIRQADLPQVSTGTKESPVGTAQSEFKPKGPSVHAKEVPSPVNKLNPRNDPDVQEGFDKHQSEHGR